ncbi:MAG TPA: hypothetical protein VN862_05200 [Candidatus Acidoferrales bacterium]|nr:hypothetical protein [Candidatus Acidoferrales bacterium]
MKRLKAVALLTVAAGLMLLPVTYHVNRASSNGFATADGTGPTPPPPPGSDNFIAIPALNA